MSVIIRAHLFPPLSGYLPVVILENGEHIDNDTAKQYHEHFGMFQRNSLSFVFDQWGKPLTYFDPDWNPLNLRSSLNTNTFGAAQSKMENGRDLFRRNFLLLRETLKQIPRSGMNSLYE